MKKNVSLLFLSYIILMTVSCAGIPILGSAAVSLVGKSPSSIEYAYEKEAIFLSLKSDSQLNLYGNSPHTLLLCLYQFRDPNAFNQLLGEKDGLQKLLECSRFDPTVTSAKTFVISPNEEKKEKLDRVEGTKYVGLIAGYYNLQKENITHLVPVPLSSLSKKPKALNINIYLGPQGIKKMEKK